MSELKITSLEELNKYRIQDYILLHQKEKNSLYISESNETYLKLFNQNLTEDHSDFLYNLLNIRWFRDNFTPHLLELIVIVKNNNIVTENTHKQTKPQLAGYIMKTGTTLTRNELLKYSRDRKNRDLWKRTMKKYKFHYNDFKASNLIKTVNVENFATIKKIGLIDLEAIRPIATTQHKEEYSEKTKANVSRKIELFDLEWYYNYLHSIQENVKTKFSSSPI